MARRYADLSHTIVHGETTYPGLPAPVITDHLTREASRERYAPGVEFQIGRIEMVSNTGTYLDTPFHRFPDGHDLSGLALHTVAGVQGVVVGLDAVHELPADLEGRAVLVHTGWDVHWGAPQYGASTHPSLPVDLAERLVDGGVALVGIDSVNIDDTSTGERPVHTMLLAAGIPIVEHLTNLAALPAEHDFEVFAVPVKVEGMGTFPVRAFAMWDEVD